jgi:hypothetical protein
MAPRRFCQTGEISLRAGPRQFDSLFGFIIIVVVYSRPDSERLPSAEFFTPYTFSTQC